MHTVNSYYSVLYESDVITISIIDSRNQQIAFIRMKSFIGIVFVFTNVHK